MISFAVEHIAKNIFGVMAGPRRHGARETYLHLNIPEFMLSVIWHHV